MTANRESPKKGAAPLTEPIRFTKLTAPNPVTKRLFLSAEGELQKASTAGNLARAQIERMAVVGMSSFVDAVNSVSENDCFVYGIPKNEHADFVVTEKRFEMEERPPTLTPRTSEAFAWPDGPGILMIDYDPDEDTLAPEDLMKVLYAACPELEGIGHAWAASTSSCIYNEKTSDQLRGIKGQRLYVAVAQAADIPRAAKTLHKKLWLQGRGYIKVSKAGSMLERSPMDMAVFQTNRIDFCASAQCDPPLEQRKEPPKVYGDVGLALDTHVALADLSAEEDAKYHTLLSKEKDLKRPEAKAQQSLYAGKRIKELVDKGIAESAARQTILDAFEKGVLHGDFCLETEDGLIVSVTEILADKLRWHGTHFCDPLEPSYHNDNRIATAYLSGARPTIHSFAHGGKTFELTRAFVTIRIAEGQRSRWMSEIADHLAKPKEEVFNRGKVLVSISRKHTIEPLSDSELLRIVDQSLRFERWTGGKNPKWIGTDLDVKWAKQLNLAYAKEFPLLRAVLTAPIIDAKTGQLIDSEGYDEARQVFVVFPDAPFPVPKNPNSAEVLAALKVVWQPFCKFPFATPTDQTVMLAAILTAVLRPLLETAPAFAFDAPAQGSGKTLLAKALAALSGNDPALSSHSGDIEETRKRLFALLVEGHSVIITDNVTGEVDSSDLASMLTTPDFTDRILGATKTRTVPTNALMLFTGNNISFRGDLPRRIPKCRIDAKQTHPQKRKFQFDPVQMVKSNRQQIVASALTLVRAMQQATASTGAVSQLGVASFDDWDAVVRQPICWLADQQDKGNLPIGQDVDQQFVPELVDPMNAFDDAIGDDSGDLQLGQLLALWAAALNTGYAAKLTVKALVGAANPQINVTQIPPARVSSLAGATPPQPTLSEVLEEIAPKNSFGGVNHKVLGNYFAKNKDRIVGNLRLQAGPTYQSAKTWWVEDMSQAAPSNAAAGQATPGAASAVFVGPTAPASNVALALVPSSARPTAAISVSSVSKKSKAAGPP
ncbi:MAG TPA: hypothetical protein VGN52_03520 [Burkholderiales bacterium]|jgi:hypothetical protein